MDLQDYGDLIYMLVEEDKGDCNITTVLANGKRLQAQ